MKKVLTFLTLAAALVAVSCSKEQENPYVGGSMVTYTIDGPVQVATKAMGLIGSEYTLYYEVRLWDGSALGDALTGEGLSGHKDIAADAWPASVSFDLARGKQYKILFWAQSKTAPEGLYNASNLAAVAIDYSKMAASEEKCDAFYGSDVITPAGATAASATLYRPFALVNLGTSDAAQFYTASGGCNVGDVKVTINGSLANSFNVATGEPGAGVATNFAPNAAPIDAYDANTLVVGETSFNYLSAVYVLPAGASDVIEVAYDIKDNASAAITSLTVSNVPVKANHRTNITGKLLTGTTTYNIDVDQAFAGNTNKVVGPTFANVTALNTYFASMADNSDNGDINPEEVTLETIADGDIITLPAIADDVVIRITGTLATGTLNIDYAASGDKPANLSLFVAQLEKLVANITSTHFTLLAGSHITDQADVHTSGSTFVIEQGAKVGTVNIHQGNAEIAGEVAKVAVPAGASADGDGAPVQVFLTKESAVKQVELNAKTDVVVEQPAENIDVAATEKKVEVLVKAEAAGSSAKAQNGGAIYVKAEGACVVISDGADDDDNPSNVTVAEATAHVTPTTVGEGEVVVKPAADDNTDDVVSNGVAMIGTTVYQSLAAAVSVADSGATITLIADDKISLTSGGEVEINKPLTITGPVDAEGKPLYTVYGKSDFTGSYNDLYLNSSTGTITVSNIAFCEFSNDVTASANGRAPLFIGSSNNYAVIENVYISDINTEAVHINGGSFLIKDCAFDCANLNGENIFTRGIQVVNQAHGTIINTDISNTVGSVSMNVSTAPIELLGNGAVLIENCTLSSLDETDIKSSGISVGPAADQPGSSQVTVRNCSVSAYIALYGDGDSNALVTVESGEYAGYLVQGNNGKGLSLTGGTYTKDPADFLGDGCVAIENSDNTWTVKETSMDYAKYNAKLYAAGGVWSEEVTVVLKESQRDIFNNGGAQFYLGRTSANINGTEGDITIKNVTFTYDADDTSVNYDKFGELQIPLSGTLTFEDCTFIGVSISPWSTLAGAQTNYPQKAEFKNCTFRNLNDRYGVHQNQAKTLVVTGCTFDTMQRGIHTNCPDPVKIEITDNTFTGIDSTKGVLCIAESNRGKITASTVVNVSGNDAAGQAFLRLPTYNDIITLAQANAILEGNTYGTPYVEGSCIPTE